MKRSIALSLILAFGVWAVDLSPPTSTERWVRATVQAHLPDSVVLAAEPRARASGTLELAVLPGRSCELALASLQGRFRLALNGRPVAGDRAREACRPPRVHALEVRATI